MLPSRSTVHRATEAIALLLALSLASAAAYGLSRPVAERLPTVVVTVTKSSGSSAGIVQLPAVIVTGRRSSGG